MTVFRSKVDIVYNTLLESITTGEYNPGDRIVISKIARESSVSEIPVREAIRRLESEGYVTINANQGAVVSGLDLDKIIQIFQIKGVLEGFAARLSIDYIKPETILKLKDINKKILRAVEQNEDDSYSELNKTFHLTIYKCVPQYELYRMIEDLWKKWGLTGRVFKIASNRAGESFKEHEIIIEMLTQKRYDEVEMFTREHKLKAGQQYVEHIKNISAE